MKNKLWLLVIVLLATSASLLYLLLRPAPKPDPYLSFADRWLADLIPNESQSKLPKSDAWEVTTKGVGPIQFGMSPEQVVNELGRPKSVDRFGKDYETSPFSLRISSNNFRFSEGRLVYGYFQLKEFPNLTIFGQRVADLTRESYKKLPMAYLEEGRQDIKRVMQGKVVVTVGFVADSQALMGKPFYISVILPPEDQLRK